MQKRKIKKPGPKAIPVNLKHFEDNKITRSIYQVFMGDLFEDASLWRDFHNIAEKRLSPIPTDTFCDKFISMERNFLSVYSRALEAAFGKTKHRRDCKGYLRKPSLKRNCWARGCPTCFLLRLFTIQEVLQKWTIPGTKVLTTTVSNVAVLDKFEQEYALASRVTISDVSSKVSRLSRVDIKVPHIYESNGQLIIAMTLISVVPDDKVDTYLNLVEKGKRNDLAMPLVYDRADGSLFECFRFPASILLPSNTAALKQITEYSKAAKFRINLNQEKLDRQAIADTKNRIRREKRRRNGK